MKIAPSLLSADFTNLKEELKNISSADYIHCDIMDGHFVPNITFGPFIVKQIKQQTKLPLDVHLMIEEPEKYIKDFILSGADILTIHSEATVHLHRTLNEIRKLGAKAGISYNPGTSIENLKYIIDEIDLVLIMTVNPGFGGQKFIDNMLNKISSVKDIIGNRNIEIEVDGGINSETIKKVKKAGANVAVAGSYIFSSLNYENTIKKLRDQINE